MIIAKILLSISILFIPDKFFACWGLASEHTPTIWTEFTTPEHGTCLNMSGLLDLACAGNGVNDCEFCVTYHLRSSVTGSGNWSDIDTYQEHGSISCGVATSLSYSFDTLSVQQGRTYMLEISVREGLCDGNGLLILLNSSEYEVN